MTWKEKYNNKYGYPKDKSHSLSDIANATGVSEKGLQEIYNKGVGAWKTNISSVRLKKDFTKNENTSKYPRKTRLGKEQWAMARVYSAVMGGEASKVDAKELKMEMGGSTDSFNKVDFYKSYYERLSPPNFEIKQNGSQIQINMNNSKNNDKVTMDVPLLIRMLEYAKEDAKDDVELHKIAERLITLSQNKTLTMDDYHKIISEYKNGGAIDTNEHLDAIDTVFLKKGGKTDFNPDGAIKDKIVHSSGKVGGMLVGKRHSEGGIQAINKSTGQPLEMEGGEVVITRDAVTDPQKRMFNGKYMTNREILSEINVSGGGVAFADGGEVPNTIAFSDSANFEFGGKTMCGCDIARRLSNGGNFDYVYKNGGIVSEADFPNSLSDATFVKDLGGSTGAKLYEYKGKQFVAKKGANKDHAKEERLANYLYNIIGIDVPLFNFIDGDTLVKQYIEDVRNVNWNDEAESKKVLKGYVADALLSNWDVYKNDNILIEKSTGTPYRIDNGGALRYRAQGGIKYNFNETVDEIKTLADNNPQIKKYITPEMIREQIDYIVTNSFGILNAVRREIELRDVLDKRIEYLANNKEELTNHFKSSSEETVEETVDIETPKEKSFEETFLENKIQDLRKKYALKKAYMSEIEKGLALREIRKFENKLDEIRFDKKSLEEILNDFMEGTKKDFGDINEQRNLSGLKSINGEKSELTKDEAKIVKSESFINWFGDWELAFETGNYEGVSKIINQKTKEPLVVYHGTDTKFTSWETYSTNNLHYFAKKKEFANWFATAWKMRTDTAGVDSQIIKSDNPIKGEYVYACFLDIKNPVDLSPFGIEKHPFNKYLEYLSVKYDINLEKIEGFDKLKDKTTPVYSWVVIRTWQNFNLHIKNNTPYDGFIFFEFIPEKPKTGFDNASLCFTAFESNQIKFANNKTFSKQSDDSRLEIGGIVF